MRPMNQEDEESIDPRRVAEAWLEEAAAFGIEEIVGFVPDSIHEPEVATPPDAAPAIAEGVSPDVPSHRGAGVGEALKAIAEEVEACTSCSLHESRNCAVPGAGSPDADFMFIGEAPGADEDAQGLPFVGRSGQLLTKMIQAMGFDRDEVFIANTLKCRPPRNRDPKPEESAACLPFLERQIALVQPRIIIALGGHAMRGLLPHAQGVGRMRGRAHDRNGIKVVVTYHPSYLLKEPSMKRAAWEDLKLALSLMGMQPPPTRP